MGMMNLYILRSGENDVEYNNMELEEGELMEDAAAAGPPGIEAKSHKPFWFLFTLLWKVHILVCGSHCFEWLTGGAMFYIWILVCITNGI